MLTRKMIIGMVLFILFYLSVAGAADRYFVDKNGSDDANGSSWATAFATIQHGINVAGDYNIVEVNEGTYTENVNFYDTICTVQSTDPNDWDIVAATIIDADGDWYAVESLGPDSELKGFTVTGGAYAGINLYCTCATISNCVIEDNSGSGIYQCECGAPAPASCLTVENCTIRNNSLGIHTDSGTATIEENQIYGNDGAGIEAGYGSTATISNNQIYGNGGDGIETGSQSTATIKENQIYGNDGEGIKTSSQSTATISNNTLYSNTKGIYAQSWTGTIENNLIYNNDVGILASSISSATIRGNTIVDNTTSGIAAASSSLTIYSCILWDNGSYDLLNCNATYSCIEDGDAGVGNISSYPYFADYDANDFHLTWNSPCINKGADGNYAGQTDIDCENRVIDGRVDMGADELSTDPGINLVKNPGFEDGVDANGTPLHWIDQWESISKTVDSYEKHSGDYSWKFTNDGSKLSGAYSDAIAVEYGKGYKLTGWIKRELGTEKIQLYWEEFNADGNKLGDHEFLDTYPGPTNWMKCGYFWEIEHEDTEYIKIKFKGPYKTAGTVWWDDFSVLEYGKEFLPPYGCVNEPNIAETVEFGGDEKNIDWVYNINVMSGKLTDANDENITYRELKAGGNTLKIEFPAFNYDTNDYNCPNTPMLLEVMYKDTYDANSTSEVKDPIVVKSKIDFINLDPNYRIDYPFRDYDLVHLGDLNDGRWKYLQYGFNKSDYQLIRAIGEKFTIYIENSSDANIPIDYVSLRKISPEEYEALVNKQRDARGFYEAELPTDAPSPPVGYDDPNLTVFVRDIMRPVYKHTKPGPNEPNSITAFSCWGEVEPLSFSIYSENGVNDINFTVSNLTHADGNTIDGNEISIYHVVYDETRLGIGWNTGGSTSIPYALKPDRLENFTSLFVDVNTSERIWLKIQVPDEDENKPAGLYTGTVTIERVGEPNVKVPIEFTVYDIELDLAEQMNSVVYSPLWLYRCSSRMDIIFQAYRETGLEPMGTSPRRLIIVTGNDPCNLEFDPCNFEWALEKMIAEEHLQDRMILFVVGIAEEVYNLVKSPEEEEYDDKDVDLYYNLDDPDFKEAFGSVIEKYIEIAADYNVTVHFFAEDEPHTYPRRRIICDRLYSIIKDPNYVNPNVDDPNYKVAETTVTYYPTCDMPCPNDNNRQKYNVPFEDGNIPPLTDLVDYKLWGISPPRDSRRSIYYGYSKHSNPKNYHGHFGYYTMGQRRNPIYNRFLQGLYAFRTDATSINVYSMASYQNDPYNDFDASYDQVFPLTQPDYLLAYPTWSGKLLYTIGGLEGIREGIKDAKYIATLKNLIAEDANNGAAQAAQYYLDEVKSRIDPNFESAYCDQLTELGYYEAVLEDISEVNDSNDFEAFTKIRKKLAEFIVLLKDGTYYAVWNKTQNKFYTTIQGGINDANDKDELLVARNTHYESLDFDGNNITLRSFYPNDWDVVENTIIDANGATQAVYFHTSEDANSVLSGLTITGSTYGVYCNSASPTITRCILRNNSSAGIYSSSSSPRITHNKICNNTSYGINSSESVPEITNNWIYKNGDTGIRFHKKASSAPNVRNNTIAYNANKGISRIGNATAPSVTNCILWDNGNELAGGGYVATYSCIKDCSDAGGGNICGDANDPCFVDADSNDFHIDFHFSPCVNAGDPCGDYDGEVDIDGDERVLGVCVDMGADEVFSPHGVQHWWMLDECSGTTAYNAVADNNNANFNGDDPCWVEGKFGCAVDFNGVYDYFLVSSLDRAYDEDSIFTVAGWFNTDQSTGKQTIVGQWSQSGEAGQEYNGWQVLVENNKVIARFGYDIPTYDITGTTDVNVGEWYHFAMVHNGTNVVVYVDGQPERTGTANFYTYDTKFRIGDGSYTYGDPPPLKGGPFNGVIDDVMIFNSALSAEEVEQLYQEGL